MNLGEALVAAKEKLALHAVPSPYLNAEVLLQRLLGVEKVFLLAHPERILSAEEEERLSEWMERRVRGEPTQYITGWQEFWGLDFEVTPDVLIPRPETEHLVEAVLKLNRSESPGIVDVGTGSGCIAVALAKEIPQSRIFAIDQSRNALQVAARNAEKHGVCQRIEFRSGNLLDPLSLEEFQGAFDFIVSNPPYVPLQEHGTLQIEVKRYEPPAALHSPFADSMEIYRRLAQQSAPRLRDGGYLMAEIGMGQDQAVQGVFGSERWTAIHFINDLQSIPRVVVAGKK